MANPSDKTPVKRNAAEKTPKKLKPKTSVKGKPAEGAKRTTKPKSDALKKKLLPKPVSDKSKTSSKDKPKTASKDKLKNASKDKPKTASKDKPKTASKDKPKTASKDKPKTASKDKPKTASRDKPKTASKPQSKESTKGNSMENAVSSPPMKRAKRASDQSYIGRSKPSDEQKLLAAKLISAEAVKRLAKTEDAHHVTVNAIKSIQVVAMKLLIKVAKASYRHMVSDGRKMISESDVEAGMATQKVKNQDFSWPILRCKAAKLKEKEKKNQGDCLVMSLSYLRKIVKQAFPDVEKLQMATEAQKVLAFSLQSHVKKLVKASVEVEKNARRNTLYAGDVQIPVDLARGLQGYRKRKSEM